MDFLKQPICWNEPSDLSGARGRMKWCHRPTICGLGRALAPSSKFARECPYPIQRYRDCLDTRSTSDFGRNVSRDNTRTRPRSHLATGSVATMESFCELFE